MTETCFIVDDEPIEAMALELILKDAFPELIVYKETSARKILELAEACKPDLLIADIQMPGINGLDLIGELKDSFPKMKVILVSAYEEFEYAHRAMQMEVKTYLVKPAGRDELVEAVRMALDEYRKERKVRTEQLLNRERFQLTNNFIQKELFSGLAQGNLGEKDFTEIKQLLGVERLPGYLIALKNIDSSQAEELQKLIRKWKMLFPVVLEFRLGEMEIVVIFCAGNSQSVVTELEKNIKRLQNPSFLFISEIYHIGTQVTDLMEAFRKVLLQPRGDNQLRLEVEEYIRNNYQRDLRAEEIAEYARFSTNYFSKWFKKHFGKTFSEYVTEYRVNQATVLLRSQGGVSVKEICFQVGFHDPNYFSRVYKKIKGMNPSDV